jgi:tRNA threonylcarbamoyladenosine biosynthesis protein TsaE
MVFEIKNISELKIAAKSIINISNDIKIWIFEGEMGAGKTTFIKSICKELGVLSNVQSPTFSLINEYITDNDDEIYHFDFYRLKNEVEALDFGVEEYFYSGNLCLIEWAEKIPNLIPEKYLKIKITKMEDSDTRIIHIEKNQ